MARDYSKSEVLDIIEREVGERGLPRDTFFRFAYIETGGRFDELANRGPNGAKGLFQFVPDTARQYGIAGKELDPVANTDAAARLYLDNQRTITNASERSGRPFLSGENSPTGLDMYMAHQQGASGYASIQQALAAGSFGRKDTRKNILNNVSSGDIESITGVGYADFKRMSDKDMAKTFVSYWGAKFDRVQIPEKGIYPIVGGRIQEQSSSIQEGADLENRQGITLDDAYQMGIRYDHVRYGFGHKSVESGKIDCSGWVSLIQNKNMEEINQKAGHEVFSRNDIIALDQFTAADLMQHSEKRSGVLLQGEQVFEPGALKEGMIIGTDNGNKGWDSGRYKGIDHIVVVVRDPQTGQLMASQSSSPGGGVEMSSLEDYLRTSGRRAATVGGIYATDPLHKARDLLQDRSMVMEQSATMGSVQEANRATALQLQQDATGQKVSQLQADLLALGYAGKNGQVLVVDGQFGAQTAHAVRDFQRMHGLTVDGIAGAKTLAALELARQQPLVTEATHPMNKLYQTIAGHLPAGTEPKAIANVTLQAMEHGIDSPAKVSRVHLNGADVYVRGTDLSLSRTDLNAPTADLREQSEHMSREVAQMQQQQQSQRGHAM